MRRAFALMSLATTIGRMNAAATTLLANATLYYGVNSIRVESDPLTQNRPFASQGAGKKPEWHTVCKVPRYAPQPDGSDLMPLFMPRGGATGLIVTLKLDTDPPEGPARQLRVWTVTESQATLNVTLRHPEEQ